MSDCIGARVGELGMRYYIVSLKHTQAEHEHIAFWGPDWRGYTPVVGAHIGEYDEETAAKLNDGMDCIAVPIEVVKTLLSPEPYYKPNARYYDQPGPVVDNTRANWQALIAARLALGRKEGVTPAPTPYKRRARSTSRRGARP